MSGPEIGTLKGSSVTLGRYSSGVVVRARQAWTDAAGRSCPADYVGRIQQLTRERFDPQCPIDVLLEDRQGNPLTLRYALSREGPRFEDLFEALSAPWGLWPGEEEAPIPSPPVFRPAPEPLPQAVEHAPLIDVSASVPPAQPQARPDSRGAFDERLKRALAFVRQGQSARAEDDWRDYVSNYGPMGDWGEAARLATRCSDQAMALRHHGVITDPAAWRWLREQSIHFWYSWAGQATSGGEGTAMMRDVRSAERAFDEAEREHLRRGGPPLDQE